MQKTLRAGGTEERKFKKYTVFENAFKLREVVAGE
jgi:hypothetical protein